MATLTLYLCLTESRLTKDLGMIWYRAAAVTLESGLCDCKFGAAGDSNDAKRGLFGENELRSRHWDPVLHRCCHEQPPIATLTRSIQRHSRPVAPACRPPRTPASSTASRRRWSPARRRAGAPRTVGRNHGKWDRKVAIMGGKCVGWPRFRADQGRQLCSAERTAPGLSID